MPHPPPLTSSPWWDGSWSSRTVRNFLTHSGHVPLVLLILEALLATPGYFSRSDPYLLLGAGLLQATLMARTDAPDSGGHALSNLIGPLFYSTAEVLLEGWGFFTQWHHLAYWMFAASFAAVQGAQRVLPRGHAAWLLLENAMRSGIPLVMYALFEARTKQAPLSWEHFFNDRAHVFLAIVLLLLGLLLGFADISLRRSIDTVRLLTARLRQYSEWTLGSNILQRAIDDEASLSLQRVQRCVLFIDIRGFTAWSEHQAPEAVVHMLNLYYRQTEQALLQAHPIKLKFTADEVMAVFAHPTEALRAAQAAMHTGTRTLAAYRLQNGAGLHWGPVVEGLLGGDGAKAYDFIGDTVNTAQRLCEAAGPGELLISETCRQQTTLTLSQLRWIQAKGKSQPVQAWVMPTETTPGSNHPIGHTHPVAP